MQPIDLTEAKTIQLEILSEIDRFCKQRGISYQLNAGTLLGAIRHQGFIPWDDDIDIAMPRRDYERFFEEFPRAHEKSPYKLVSHRDKSSIYPFFKVVDDRTVVYEKYVDGRYSTGIWVDIFPFDDLPRHNRPFISCARLQTLFGLITANPDIATTGTRKIVKKITTPILKHLDIYAIAEKMDRIARNCADGSSTDVGIVLFGYGARERLPRSVLESIEIPFEGKPFSAPKHYDMALRHVFGDYMELPPENERIPHDFKAYWKEESRVHRFE